MCLSSRKNVNARFKTKVQGLIWVAAKATDLTSFSIAMENIKRLSPAIYGYLMESGPQRWAASLFPHPRFGCITSNSAESFNSWIEDLRDVSYLRILMGWVSKVAKLFYERKTRYMSIDSEIPPKALTRLGKLVQEGAKNEIVQFSEAGFEVRGATPISTCIVQLDALSCSCGMFREMQFPCEHAAASISKVGGESFTFLA
jgi:SWIM zinc finger